MPNSLVSHRQFLRLSLPNMLATLSFPVASLVDTAFLGHLPSPHYLAGVALSLLIFDYIYWSFGFLRMGTTGLTAQAYGAEDREEMARIFWRGLVMALTIGVALWSLQWLILPTALTFLSGSEAAETATASYFLARIHGAPAALGIYVLAGWLLGQHRAKSALLIALLLNSLNIVLDYIFIIRLQLNAAGAGYATACAEWLAFFGGVLIIRFSKPAWPRWISDTLNKASMLSVVRLNSNLMLRTLCLLTGFALFTNASAMLGTAVLAANTLLLRLLQLSSYVLDAYALALEAMGGKGKGANNNKALSRALTIAHQWNAITVTGFLLLFGFGGTFLLSLLTDHQAIIIQASVYLPWLLASLAIGSLAYLYDGLLIGLTAGHALRNGMLVALFGGMLPCTIIGIHISDNHWLWIGMVMFMLLRAASLMWWVHGKNRVI